MKTSVLLFIILFLTTVEGYGQKFFLARSDGSLESVTITATGPVSTVVTGCGGNYFSIATLGNKLYWLDGYGLLSGDLTSGPAPTLTNCRRIANSIANNIASNALVVDNNGVVYFTEGYKLFAIFPNTTTPVLVGTMPYYSAGDLIFYKNELCMASPEGIVKVPLNNPSKSTIYFNFQNSGIYGLASAVVNGKNTVYAIVASTTVPAEILELDMEGRKVKRKVGTVPYYVNDGASEIPDADIPIIEVANTNITQECNVFNKARVEIVCKPHSGQYTFTLNTGEKNNIGVFDNVSQGKHTVIITSTENAVNKPVDFTVNDYTIGGPVIAALTKNPKCNIKGEIKLDAGIASSTYKIKYGNDIFGFDHTFTGLIAGSYHFTILNAQGCITDEKDYTLQQDACPIVISDTKITQECDVFNKAHVEVICELHTSIYTFTLNTGQKNTTGIFDNLVPGSYQVNITSNGNETPTVTNFTVNDFTIGNPVITANQKNPKCNTKGEIKLDAGAASSSYKIKYGSDVFGFDHTFTGLIAASYHFTILNAKGCIADEKDYTLVQDECPPVGVLNANITQECDVFNKAHVEIVCNLHINQYTFTLNSGQKSTTGIFDNLGPGDYKVTVSSNGDESPVTLNFTVVDYTIGNPVITFIQKNPICDLKGQIKLDAGVANSSYSIKYGNDIFGFDHTFTGLIAGNYHFTILNSNGCIADEKDFVLQQDECPPIVISNIDIKQRCDVFNQASVQVATIDHPDTYTYTLNSISNSTGFFDAIAPGTYNLVITSSGGDRKEQQLLVPDYSLNHAAITYKIKNAICTLPGEIKFTAKEGSQGASQIKHGTDVYSINQTITGLTSGVNYFTVLNQQGCIVDTLNVNIPQDDCNAVVFPNTFTPNGDGINDVFRPKQDSNPVNYRLLIYDRQGAFIFQSLSFYTGWDGTFHGRPVAFGIYYWIVNYTLPGAKTATQSGFVTLIK
jgi:gliding motility-associated-like protein